MAGPHDAPLADVHQCAQQLTQYTAELVSNVYHYTILEHGGIWPSPPEGHSFVQLYIEVDDLAASVQKATAVGASVIIPPQKLPDGDEMAIILDPQGIPFAVFKAK